jgi:hypothetical protein
MILRCTSRMLDVIGGKPELIDIGPSDDDWYANVVYIDGKKCVLLVHVSTLFSTMALNVGVGLLRPIGGYVYSQIVRALEREGFPRDALGVIDYHQIHLAPTRSRSVLGSMNDMVIMARQIIRSGGGLANCDVGKLNRLLHDTPNQARGLATPLELVRQRLAGESG